MNETTVTLVGVALNFALAYFVKKGGAPTLRKLIPIVNLIIGLLTQAGAAMTQATAVAPVAPAVATAGFFFTLHNTFLDILVNGIVQGLLTTGAHSTQKNVREAAK